MRLHVHGPPATPSMHVRVGAAARGATAECGIRCRWRAEPVMRSLHLIVGAGARSRVTQTRLGHRLDPDTSRFAPSAAGAETASRRRSPQSRNPSCRIPLPVLPLPSASSPELVSVPQLPDWPKSATLLAQLPHQPCRGCTCVVDDPLVSAVTAATMTDCSWQVFLLRARHAEREKSCSDAAIETLVRQPLTLFVL